MTDFSINGTKTGGTIYELKSGIKIKEAHEKGKNDKIDQVYFQSDGKSYVLQGESLNLTGLNKGELPANNVNLDGKKIEVVIDGKKVEAVIANAAPENKIKINGKDVNAKIIAIDNEVNTKGEAFGDGVGTIVGKIGIGLGAFGVGAGVLGAISHGMDEFGKGILGKATGESSGMMPIILGGLAVVAVTVGATGLFGMYKESKTTANPAQLKPLLGKIANF